MRIYIYIHDILRATKTRAKSSISRIETHGHDMRDTTLISREKTSDMKFATRKIVGLIGNRERENQVREARSLAHAFSHRETNGRLV